MNNKNALIVLATITMSAPLLSEDISIAKFYRWKAVSGNSGSGGSNGAGIDYVILRKSRTVVANATTWVDLDGFPTRIQGGGFVNVQFADYPRGTPCTALCGFLIHGHDEFGSRYNLDKSVCTNSYDAARKECTVTVCYQHVPSSSRYRWQGPTWVRKFWACP